MKRFALTTAALCLAFGVIAFTNVKADDDNKPKHTIKEVMKQAHKDKLINKVLAGDASKEEKDQLLDLYISLIDNKPKKGEQTAWMMRAGRLTVAAARVAVGREGAIAELKTASNCAMCHKAHK